MLLFSLWNMFSMWNNHLMIVQLVDIVLSNLFVIIVLMDLFGIIVL